MAFISASSIAVRKRKSRGGAGRKSRDPDALVFRSYVGKNGRPQLAVAIYSNLLKKARFIKGDRIDLCFDAIDRTGLLKRVGDSNGYALTTPGSSVSKTAPLEVKMTWYEGMPSIDGSAECENVVVGEEGILFNFPRGTSFNGLVAKRLS